MIYYVIIGLSQYHYFHRFIDEHAVPASVDEIHEVLMLGIESPDVRY